MDFNDTSSKIILVAVVLLTGLIVTGAVMWGAQPGANTADVNIADVKLAGDPYLGQASASTTIALWGDYQCPICKNLELSVLPQIVKDYVDTGKVKIVLLDFAFLGEDSTTAARYGRSVWKLYPDKYHEWRTAMYAAQDDEGDKGFGDAASIDKLNASIVGLDAAKIAADVNQNGSVYQAAIDADRVEVTKAGITGTPSMIIGTKLIVGSHPYADYQAAINAVLPK